jgi:hypothetical protein
VTCIGSGEAIICGVLRDILPRWQVRYLADGLALVPPEGRTIGGIRIRERIQPLHRARDVIAWVLDQMRGFEQLAVLPVETLTTHEGEYAALVTITARRGAIPFERTIGLVWGDFFYTQIDGGTDDEASFARFRRAVRDLTTLHALGLGERRRRRFVYAPPPGWRPYPRGLITEWYAPGFPADHGFISVFPARAEEASEPSQLDRLLHEMSWFGFEREGLTGPDAITTRDGLQGSMWRTVGRFGEGPRLFYEIAVFYDQRFIYVLRLESKERELAENSSVFGEVVRSVEHLPRPVAATGAAALLGDWIA